jgi:hypothetical protein
MDRHKPYLKQAKFLFEFHLPSPSCLFLKIAVTNVIELKDFLMLVHQIRAG